MKISYENLKKVFDLAKGVINKKGSYEILKCIAFRGNEAHASSGDKMAIRIKSVCENGNNAIHIDEVKKVLSVFEKGDMLKIENGEVSNGTTTMKIVEKDITTYPKITNHDDIKPYMEWELNKTQIEKLRNASKFVDKANNSDNKILKQVNIRQEGEKFSIIAMDGYKLYIYEDKIGKSEKKIDIFFCEKTIKLIGKKVDKIEVRAYEKVSIIEFDNAELLDCGLQAVGILTDKIMNENYKLKVNTKAEDIVESMKKFENLNKAEEYQKPVILSFNDKEINIDFESMDNKLNIAVNGKVQGGGIDKIGFNAKYYREVCEIFNGEIEMKYSGNRNPVVISQGNEKILLTAVNC